jgi:hypothetical protein
MAIIKTINTSVGMDVKKQETYLYTVGGNAECCSHHRQQYEVSPRDET